MARPTLPALNLGCISRDMNLTLAAHQWWLPQGLPSIHFVSPAWAVELYGFRNMQIHSHFPPDPSASISTAPKTQSHSCCTCRTSPRDSVCWLSAHVHAILEFPFQSFLKVVLLQLESPHSQPCFIYRKCS